MTSQPLRVERRAGQRFQFALPVSLREHESGLECMGFTLDVSSRGLFLSTEAAVQEGAEVELMFSMPSEITLGESMMVRAQGRVLRVARMDSAQKVGVAVRLLSYEYLPDAPGASAAFYRISELHRHSSDEPAATLTQ